MQPDQAPPTIAVISPPPAASSPAQPPTPEPKLTPVQLDWLWRAGFASIFLVNSLVAWLEPEDFINLLEANFIGKHLSYIDWMVKLAAVNDLALGLAIVVGKWRRLVYVWAALWLLLVAGLKLSNMIL